ncbi:guanine-specific ribonuclease N1 and T1 [Candidatus Vecturithrix granuli]|uniref:Guanine-specific ribonuclease N1 and T1 n=1 Tax=Vecturithrix granuli TaxID=1499967 RepID=A0A081BVV5_VECG1|nr:guanine-specific ribonuclease N1 and T1 [Candidatus Vecturithrix granuli]
MWRKFVLFFLVAAGIGFYAYQNHQETSQTPSVRSVAVNEQYSATISPGELPPEAIETLQVIKKGPPFPYTKDGTTFGNREQLLPRKPDGYYREFTVKTPGISHRGARRIVVGQQGELYYTDDHYQTFREILAE